MNPSRAIPAGSPEPAPGAADGFDLTNVVPFTRARSDSASTQTVPIVAIASADRPLGAFQSNRVRLATLIACSAALHAALYLPFAREPEPMASIGELVITAEIVVGANTPAGPTDDRGQAEASAPEPAKTPDPAIDQPKPELAQAEQPKPEPARTEPPFEAVTSANEPQHVPVLPESQEQRSVTLQAPAEPVDEQTRPEAPPAAHAVAAAEPHASPNARQAVAEPPVPAPPRDAPREASKPRSKKLERPRQETRRASLAGATNEQRSTVPAATAAGGVGRGRSDLNSNYAGLVATHLARFKQFPSDARARGDQGRATVTFSLGSGGGVTSVRLTRGTGFASLDAEATAMVRRASPFPAPPDGRPISFTVPVNFRLN